MTVEEALAIFDHLAGQMVGTRADHEKVAEAIETLRQALPVDE